MLGAAAADPPACTMTPDLIRMVESSRRAVGRVGGSVPCQPRVGATGNVRCNLRRTEAGGTKGGVSSVSFEDLGRNEARIVNEFNIP